MSLFPDDDKVRKMLPIFEYFTRYFPKAHREVTKVCVVNNVRYNPDRKPEDINWARGKSPNQLGSGFRHMLEAAVDGKVFEAVPADIAKITGIERVYVLAEAMWRLGAELELTIEREEDGAAMAHHATVNDVIVTTEVSWPPAIGTRGKGASATCEDTLEGVVIGFMKDDPDYALLQTEDKTGWVLSYHVFSDRPIPSKGRGWWAHRSNFKPLP